MLIFFGSSRYSAQFLERATKNGLKVDLVVSRPPKPIGRKQILTENPTVTAAKNFEINYIEKLKDLSETLKLCVSETLVGLILDYNKIIPLEIINLFPKSIINIHFSKLPQYRGPAPVQTAILNGDTQTAITYFLITENIDDGPILKQTPVLIKPDDTAESLYQKMIIMAAEEIVLVVANRLSDKDHPCQQQGNPTFTTKLITETTKIDWQKSPVEIDRLIRAAYPEPGAWTEIELQRSKEAKKQSNKISETRQIGGKLCNSDAYTKRLKILKAHLEGDKLIPDLVQLEGKKPVSWKQFQEGYPEAQVSLLSC